MLNATHISLDPIELSLDKIFLDPNNPRFATDESIQEPDENIGNQALQEELLNRIEREFGLGPLMDSIEENGYLPIDRIVVRRFESDKYVVLEGNRRVAAAKLLLVRNAKGNIKLNQEVIETLNHIPALLYIGEDQDAAWLFQGLRHISGIKDWPAYNKARLLVDQLEERQLSFTDAGRVFGLTSFAAGQYIRGYYAYKQALEHPDYDDVVDQRAFPFFQELFGRSNIVLREWMKWDDKEKKFSDEERFPMFLSWLYPKRNLIGEDDPDQPGDWNQRRIPRAIDLRSVSDLLSEHPQEFNAFLNGTDLSAAVGRATAKQQAREEDVNYFIVLVQEFTEQMNRLPIIKIVGTEQQNNFAQKIENLKTVLHKVLKYVSNS